MEEEEVEAPVRGRVYIVGAGPGDPELITLKALKILQQADVVIYADSLVNPEVLRYVKSGCEIYQSSRMSLEEIVDVITRKVGEGKIVVRLKSGDPAIYGALLEEIIELEKAGIDYEIIPGVTAMTAAAAVSKISLTAPEKLQAIVIARPSHRAPMEVDLKELLTSARGRATVVFYLATAHLKSIVDAITASGYPSSTPATVVYRATWGDQKIVTGTLEDIVEKVEREGIARDYILIVGPPNTPDLRRGAPRSVVYSREKQHQKH